MIFKPFKRVRSYYLGRRPKKDQLLTILEDEWWHSRRELRRRIGPTFFLSLFALEQVDGFRIERREKPHPPWDREYRLVMPAEDKTVLVRSRTNRDETHR
jgi:hypothetical protein